MPINDSKDKVANDDRPPAYSDKSPQHDGHVPPPPDLSARLKQLDLASVDEVC